MAKRRRRRTWSEDEKRMICAQTRVPGVSVAQVARRYDVNANQVFNWLKEPRFASEAEEEPVTRFLPVEVLDAEPAAAPPDAGAQIEVELANGHRLKVQGGFDPDALAALIRKLSA
ncbi:MULTISPECIES: IS66-like element accessory protein TnpA [Roseobacteraceae]|uniref:IS66-like element accessory protein TnpA n=1 Tax=Roseobacteraceae TaxID=2854170 RepID=UPI0021A63B60|nr:MULTISPECIES: transposase [Roseobacteraceae]UWQ77102.1 transposase [Leisingera sp. M658]UWR48125.1 transposase [Phaeobacter inhibens]UWR59715.1 transposase [Phaeobacter inhibens]